MKLEVGKKYRLNNGEVFICEENTDTHEDVYPFKLGDCTYTENGLVLETKGEHKWNVKEEVVEKKGVKIKTHFICETHPTKRSCCSFYFNTEGNKMELKNIDKKNITAAKKKVKEDMATAEQLFAQAQYKDLLDKQDWLKRERKKLDEAEAEMNKEYAVFMGK